MPVHQQPRTPAATACTGPDGLRRVDGPIKNGTDADDARRPGSFYTRVVTSDNRPAKCKPTGKNNGPIDHLDTIPIDTAQPPRLPPWEDFQRGPPVHQAALTRLGPRRKSFTIPVIDRPLRLPQCSPSKPPFAAGAKSGSGRTHRSRTLLPLPQIALWSFGDGVSVADKPVGLKFNLLR